MRNQPPIHRVLSRSASLALAGGALLVALAASGHTLRAADLPSWPLQQQPGPDGDPRQDRSSYPRSSVPPSRPVEKPVAKRPAFTERADGDFVLGGGWKLSQARKVAGTARELSLPGFDASRWLDATVPGSVLTTLVDRGVYPEPTYGLDNMAIPESLSREDYWYRNEFTPPAAASGRAATLTLEGVNYAGEAWLNGTRLGSVTGAFRRGIFDVTALLRPGQLNALVVRVSPVPHPGIPHEESLAAGAGPNGGAMLFDGPTFFCTEGWDWIPGIRDRVTGLWQDVVLHVGGPLVLGDLQVKTDLPLPDTSSADVSVTAELANRTAERQQAVVHGEFEGVSFEKPVELAPRERTVVRFVPGELPQLRVKAPRLWWPNGYGRPELYHLELSVRDGGGHVTETKAVRFGIRELTYELSALDAQGELKRFELAPSAGDSRLLVDKSHPALRESRLGWVPTLAAGALSSPAVRPLADASLAPFLVIRVNGQRVVAKGGNWGLDEAMKRVSRERMEPFFRLERDAHLTMVRNWCGQNTEQVFSVRRRVRAHGLERLLGVHPGLEPRARRPRAVARQRRGHDPALPHPPLDRDLVRQERGRPPPYLNERLDALVRELDGTRYYQPSSVKVNLLDSGPWVWGDPVSFFSKYGKGFTTELGLPSVPTADALRAMMPAADQWPISDTWAYHDWHQKDHGEVQAFTESLAKQLGAATGLDDFARKAQLLNYVGHRALFEGLNARLWVPASGRLMWMSHPAWPSMEWQLYSSDYDAHASYYGAKKACEPLHVQLNLDDRKVVVTNNTFAPLARARVSAELYDVAARRVGQQTAVLDAAANATTAAFSLDESRAAALPLYFVRLALVGHDGRVLSDNFYWQARREEDHQALNALAEGRAGRDGAPRACGRPWQRARRRARGDRAAQPVARAGADGPADAARRAGPAGPARLRERRLLLVAAGRGTPRDDRGAAGGGGDAGHARRLEHDGTAAAARRKLGREARDGAIAAEPAGDHATSSSSPATPRLRRRRSKVRA